MKRSLFIIPQLFILVFLLNGNALAASRTWNNTGTDFNQGGSWLTGTAPVTGDTAVFATAGTTNPNLTSSLSLAVLSFSTVSSSGYTVSSLDGTVKFTLTGNGTGASSSLNAANTSGTNIISASLVLGQGAAGTAAFNQATGGTMVLNGDIANINNIASGLSFTGGGLFVIGGTSNSYSIATSISAATTVAVNSLSNAGSGGSLGSAQINLGSIGGSSGTLRYLGSGQTSDQVLNLTNNVGSALNVGIESSGSGALVLSNATAFNFTGTGGFNVVLGGTNSGNNTVQGVISNNVSGTRLTNLVKTGGGTWLLSGSNTYTGVTTVSGGVLSVSDLENGGQASNIGASSAAAANLIIDGGTLQYTGTGGSTDRLLSIGVSGGTIDSSGSGALKFTGTASWGMTGASTARTVTLTGTNLGDNTIAAAIPNRAASPALTSVVKNGTGKWILTGANTYGGGTVVNLGTLVVNNTAGSATGSGAVLVSAAGSSSYGTLGGGSGVANGGTLSALTGGASLQTYVPGVTGIITGAVTVNQFAHLAPGNSVGTITMASLTLDGGSVLDYEFNGAANDFTSVTGALSLTSTVEINLFGEGTTNAFSTVGTYNLFSYGSVTGFSLSAFSVLNQVGGFNYTFVNDTADKLIQVNISSVPEPQVWALACLGLAIVWFKRHRRILH